MFLIWDLIVNAISSCFPLHRISIRPMQAQFITPSIHASQTCWWVWFTSNPSMLLTFLIHCSTEYITPCQQWFSLVVIDLLQCSFPSDLGKGWCLFVHECYANTLWVILFLTTTFAMNIFLYPSVSSMAHTVNFSMVVASCIQNKAVYNSWGLHQHPYNHWSPSWNKMMEFWFHCHGHIPP